MLLANHHEIWSHFFVHLHLSCAMPFWGVGVDWSQDFVHVVPHHIAKSQTGTAFLNVLNSLFPNQKATIGTPWLFLLPGYFYY